MLVRVYVCDRENEIVKRKDRRVKTDRRTFDTKYTMAIYYVLLYGTKRSDIYNDIRCRWRRLLFSVRRIGMRRGSWEFCLKSSTTECVFLLPPSDSVVRPFVSILNKWLKFIDFQWICLDTFKSQWKYWKGVEKSQHFKCVSSRVGRMPLRDIRGSLALYLYMWIIYD